MLAKVNHEQRLYVIAAGSGYSCLGFDVAERKRRAVLEWIGVPVEAVEPGTEAAFAAYQDAMRRGAEHARATGKRCDAELTPALVGLEGRRVEVAHSCGDGVHRERFWVGKSTGWMPCHLEVKTRRSLGGSAVYLPQGATVSVVSDARRTR